MRKLSTKKVKTAHELITAFNKEVADITFDVPSMLQYCLENDLRHTLKLQKFRDQEIDSIIKNSGFQISPKIAGLNKVKFNVDLKDYSTFQKCFIGSNF